MTSVLVVFFGYVSSNDRNKSKNKQIGLHQTTVLHIESNCQQNEIALREDICKHYIQ